MIKSLEDTNRTVSSVVLLTVPSLFNSVKLQLSVMIMNENSESETVKYIFVV